MTLQNFTNALLICFALQIGSVFFSSDLFAQSKVPVSTSEIGVGIGGANYKGELAPNYRFLNNQPAMTVFYRRDMSNAVTLRGGLMGSHRVLNDNTLSDEAYADSRPFHAFRQAEAKLSLFEVSGVMEYNFLDYYDLSQKVRISPYVFVGVAGLLYNVKLSSSNPDLGRLATAPGANDGGALSKPYDTNVTVAIPFGVGVKYALSKHWNLGLEFGARKLITDQLDYLSDQDPDHLANPYDKDWYFYNGVSVSYTFYRTNCPPVYKNKAGLLD